MNTKTYTISDKDITKEVELINTDQKEWIDFLSSIIKSHTPNKKISLSDIEEIDSNYCIPLCILPDKNGKLSSIICDNIGYMNLRLWLGENGIKSSLITFDDIGDPNRILKDFNKWWIGLPIEAVKIGKYIISKRGNKFGTGHLQAWISYNLKHKHDGSAYSKYISEIIPWIHTYELVIFWNDNNLIDNDNGYLSVN